MLVLPVDDPHAGIVVTGDFNAFEFTNDYVNAVGQIVGNAELADNLLS